ncbi:alpha/beta hydrolase [Ideonella azotifigens]|uniref:Alpha/beta hydrolase n=1 Tax=Ideonella azotifigens TaxID=513160 RepID=A0ABP3V3I5_9BURK|nr:alpha/beta fold hydrolase [Ideonella azotifigens]MCD2343231.1 alpha/beta hydrolase [Ideonella azotifigens]
MPVAQVNGARLNYVQMAPEDATDEVEDLIMVHGLATNMAFWYFHYAPVFSQRFRVTLFDLRGHGRSEMTESGYEPPDLAQDLLGLMDHLGIRKAHFLTHSYGGVVALNAACLAPHRFSSLVLADTHIAAARHEHHWEAGQFGTKMQAVLDEHGIGLDTRDPYFGYKLLTEVAHLQLRSEEVPAVLQEMVSPFIGKYGNRTASQWIRLMDQTKACTELMGDDGLRLDELRKLQFPIMAMYGDHSQARLTGRELLEVWGHAVFRRVRDGGHFFPSSRPQELISGCNRFWGGEFGVRHELRTGEPKRNFFRSDRIFQAGEAWYFTTREHARVGPAASRAEAEQVLASFIAAMATEQLSAVSQ